MAVAVGSMTLPANVAVAGGGLSTRTLWANCESWFYYEKCMKGEDRGKERKGKEKEGRFKGRKNRKKGWKVDYQRGREEGGGSYLIYFSSVTKEAVIENLNMILQLIISKL